MASDDRRRLDLRLLGVALIFLAGSGAWGWSAGDPAAKPHPSQGKINGMTAMTVMPQETGTRDLLPPWGYVAHLTGHDDPAVDIAFPSGGWTQPPAGRYRVWIEGDWKISPSTHVINFSSRPFRGGGMVTSALVADAGRVALPPDFQRHQGDLSLRLLHAGDYLVAGYPRWELSRRKPVKEVEGGLLMPVGLNVAAIWDEHSGSYVALSRPFEVKRRETVVAPLKMPRADETHLVAQIQRASLARDADDLKLKIVLFHAGRAKPPDFQVSTADRAYAMWYGLDPGPAELRAEADDTVLEPQSIKLKGGRIERIFRVMREQPAWARAPHP